MRAWGNQFQDCFWLYSELELIKHVEERVVENNNGPTKQSIKMEAFVIKKWKPILILRSSNVQGHLQNV